MKILILRMSTKKLNEGSKMVPGTIPCKISGDSVLSQALSHQHLYKIAFS